MTLQIRDLICENCDAILRDVACAYGDYPCCEACGGRLQVCWSGGQPPATDVYGVAQYSDATGQWHTSQSDKKRVMRNAGFEEAGDPVHGARPDHRLKGSAFSFSGQTDHRTVAEGQ